MKITLEHSLELNPQLNPDLFMPDPKTVLEKLHKPPISEWLDFISREYEIQKIKNLILIPCSFYKPYDPPNDEFYRRINQIRRKSRNTKFIAVSVPLALEPEEYWNFQWKGYNLNYDCPFFPWVEKFGYEWNENIAQKVLSKLICVIDAFFERNKHFCQNVIAFLIPDSYELKLVKKHVDILVLDEGIEVDVSYDNNTSEIYCHPKIWRRFEEFIRLHGIC